MASTNELLAWVLDFDSKAGIKVGIPTAEETAVHLCLGKMSHVPFRVLLSSLLQGYAFHCHVLWACPVAIVLFCFLLGE